MTPSIWVHCKWSISVGEWTEYERWNLYSLHWNSSCFHSLFSFDRGKINHCSWWAVGKTGEWGDVSDTLDIRDFALKTDKLIMSGSNRPWYWLSLPIGRIIGWKGEILLIFLQLCTFFKLTKLIQVVEEYPDFSNADRDSLLWKNAVKLFSLDEGKLHSTTFWAMIIFQTILIYLELFLCIDKQIVQ